MSQVAKDLGVPTGERVRALLDVHSVSVTGGTISLHNDSGVPLRGLGIGSARLLIAGLQRVAARQSTIILIDELEYGLEPHRIIRLLTSLGAKEKVAPSQAFISTHSPVALRELSGVQLFVLRSQDDHHEVKNVGATDEIQGTIRKFPEAFLAPCILVCEGASEVGFIRGVDLYRASAGEASIGALGVGLVDGGGDETFSRASAFLELGYRVAVLRDDDKAPKPEVEAAFQQRGGTVFSWRQGRALEDEMFLSLSDDAVYRLMEYAVELHGEDLINDHIKSVSENREDLKSLQIAVMLGNLSQEQRELLASAAKRKRQSWFKNVTYMEHVSRDIICPDLPNADKAFPAIVERIFAWTADAGT